MLGGVVDRLVCVEGGGDGQIGVRGCGGQIGVGGWGRVEDRLVSGECGGHVARCLTHGHE